MGKLKKKKTDPDLIQDFFLNKIKLFILKTNINNKHRQCGSPVLFNFP